MSHQHKPDCYCLCGHAEHDKSGCPRVCPCRVFRCESTTMVIGRRCQQFSQWCRCGLTTDHADECLCYACGATIPLTVLK